jgi:GntR family transcriptional regulator of arabinose operon
MAEIQTRVPKYQQVYDALRQQIVSGQFPPGTRLPSEAQLEARFGASRITVGRALRDLQRAGLVARRVGSGTYVEAPRDVARHTLGVLVPDAADTDIFEPMLEGLMTAPQAEGVAFVRGGLPRQPEARAAAAWAVTEQYLARRVAGVFFAPLEGLPEADRINRRIVDAFDAAGIPVVLLDRSVYPYPLRGPYDLVGIDNRRAGYLATSHLQAHGATRLAFLARPHAAPTVQARRAGYREALAADGSRPDSILELEVDPTDAAALEAARQRTGFDAIVCANDRLAADAMRTLLRLGLAVPGDVRLIGIDDAEFAPFLPVPLTTVRQPCRQIGIAAAAAMMERLARPDLPARDIFLQTTLVVRESCGATSPSHTATAADAQSTSSPRRRS